jgi:hypothetical protein
MRDERLPAHRSPLPSHRSPLIAHNRSPLKKKEMRDKKLKNNWLMKMS